MRMGTGRGGRGCLAMLGGVLLAAATAAGATLDIRVVTHEKAGRKKPVAGARVALAAGAAIVDGERALALSSRETDAAGRLSVPWERDETIVIAGIPGRGLATARVPPTAGSVRIVLPPEARLEGRVVDPRGRPVPGAEVVVAAERPADAGGFLTPGTVFFRAFTGGNGRFAVDRLDGGGRYRVRVRVKGLATAIRRDAAPSAPPLEIRLTAGARVLGTVIATPGDHPLAGAEVTVGDVTARTGPDGRFDLAGIAPGRHRLRVVSAGHVHLEEKILVLAEGERREGLVVRVLGTARIHGRVLGPSTRPAPGAEIFLRYPSDPSIADRLPEDRLVRAGVAGEDGRFDGKGLLPAQGVDLIARHPDHAPVVHLGYTLAAGRTLDVIVLLRRGGTLSGRVLDEDGGEVAGARVLVLSDRRDPAPLLAGRETLPPTARRATTAEDGSFRVEHVPAGRRTLVALAEGHLPSILRGVEVGEGASRSGLLLLLGKGTVLAGRVLGPGRKPLPGAVVTIAADLVPPRTARTNEEGRFGFFGIPAAPYRVTVRAEGYDPVVRVAVKAPVTDLSLELAPAGGLSGRVVLGEAGEAVPRAMVRALRREPPLPLAPDKERYREVARVRTAAPGGRFTFPDLPGGSYRLEAWTEDGLFGFLERVSPGPGGTAREITVRVIPGWSVRGRVVRARDGRPVEGALVAVRGVADRPGPLRARTDARGVFSLAGVPEGFHRLLVSARDLSPAVVDSVLVRAAAVTRLPDIPLGEGARVGGVVTGPDGSRRSGVRITLRSAELSGVRQTLTDDGGVFLFEHVSPGSYLLAAETSAPPRETARDESLIRVAAGEDLFLAIGRGTGATLTGQITARGVPVPHALVTALPLEDGLETHRRILSTRSDADGDYTLADLDPGDYLLSVRAATGAGTAVRLPVRVLPGPVTIFDPVLPDSGIEGRVEDLDTGEPIAGALLVLTSAAGRSEGTFLERLTRETGELRSGEDGTFRFSAVPPGEYRIDAWLDGYGQSGVEGIQVAPGGLSPVRIALPRAGEVRVVVVDRRLRPLSSAEVSFLDARGRPGTRPSWLPVDSGGRLVLRSLRAGRYTVRARAPGHALASREGVEVFPGGHPDVRIMLGREGRLVLTVYGPGMLPLEGARIAVRDFWGGDIPFPAPPVGLRTPWRDPSRTDEKGEVTILHLPAGIYSVSATFPGYAGDPLRVRVLDGEVSRGAVTLLPR